MITVEFETREALRDAVEDCRISIADAVAMWSAEDPHHTIVQEAGQRVAELADVDEDGM